MFFQIKENSILMYVLFILIVNNSKGLEDYSFSSQCMIDNEKYRFEYLYHSDEIINLNRSTAIPYMFPLKHLTNLKKIRWILKFSRNSSSLDTFLIKSYKSNKYLCGSNRHLDRFRIRRRVFLSNNYEQEACEWNIEKVISKNNQDQDELGMKSYITNVKYGESLYAASYFFKQDQFKRSIYLWHEKNEKFKSKQFNWIIECLG